ncbi:uncharacterized protein LOC114281890 [Camellia sinensis]|uniref:uncharacterized protein LOC114281890 n=1 Tax=Camellia sinensis TaxID=4442 RepID=UPI0010367F7B|nr:uncharacterized protein LOC114281890 [Camellia sinensis]
MIKESRQVAELSWRQFEEFFMEKYFPNSVRQEMIQEFLQLKQRGMTVTQYANRFEALSRHATAIVANKTDKIGLLLLKERRWTLQGPKISSLEPTNKGAEDPQGITRPLPLRYLMLGGHNNSKGIMLSSVMGKGLEGVVSVAKKVTSGATALKGQATKSINEELLSGTNERQLREHKLCKIPDLVEGATGRVFTLQEEGDNGNPSVIQEPERLETPISVASPLGGQTRVDLVCKSCELGVSNLRLTCDLRVMEMSDFDVILGMDWLSAHRATINCYRKTVTAYS